MFKFTKILVSACFALGVAASANAVSFGQLVNPVASAPATSATGRPATAPRMPSIGGYYGYTTPGGVVTTTPSLADQDYINLYLDCLRGTDACGPQFEECTTKTLFFGRKSICAAQLILMPATALNTLFGTAGCTAQTHVPTTVIVNGVATTVTTTTTATGGTNQACLANRSATEKDENGDYAFIFPTDGSTLGGMIIGASVNNRLSTQDCVKKYQQCLQKDDVCGQNFELCTSFTEFKKQKIFCSSTLMRCGDEGKKELFGTTDTTGNPSDRSRLGILIQEGGDLAAVNAVATCYKVADTCILNTCGGNPYRCKEGTDTKTMCTAASAANPDASDPLCADGAITIAINRGDITGFVKNSCLDTIGANKYCYATANDGKMPTAAQLGDPDNRSQVFSNIFGARFNDGMKAKINDMIAQFNIRTAKRCQDTIVQCAMQSCGDGSGASCYAIAFDKTNPAAQMGVTNPKTLAQIKYGCESLVNADTACKYVAASFNAATGAWNWASTSIFDILFTAPDDTSAAKPDATGAVATLNARLSQSYNQAALDNMRLQCQAVAKSCITSQCGGDFSNCFRNRTDIVSSIGGMPSSTGMNYTAPQKAGGVLDRAIVIGLCIGTVRDNQICSQHIKTESARITAGNTSGSVWGGQTTPRGAWLDAGTVGYTKTQTQVQVEDGNGNLMCLADANNTADSGRCDGTDGPRYTIPYMVSSDQFATKVAENQIFTDLVRDMELQAQAQYSAKLTRQQNMCFANNSSGGILGNQDMGSTFMWAKLNSSKVPADYAVKGLTTNQFKASNELYGSFCRVRITLQSDDAKIRDAILNGQTMKNYAIAYFAVGDSFTCGSWIPTSALDEIAKTIAAEKYASGRTTRNWITAAVTVATMVGGGIGTNAILNNTRGLGGLLPTHQNTADSPADSARAATYDNCVQAAQNNLAVVKGAKSTDSYNVYQYLSTMTGGAEGVNYITVNGTPRWLYSVEKTSTTSSYPTTMNAATAQLNNIIQQCQDLQRTVGKTQVSAGPGKTWTIIGGTMLAGAAGFFVTRAALNDAAHASADAAAQEWMNNVGKHIKCYIGGDEVGTFGDIIGTSME